MPSSSTLQESHKSLNPRPNAGCLRSSAKTRNLHSLEMIRQHAGQLGGRQPPEAAIGAEAELRQVLAGGCDPLLEARHAVDGAEIDPRALWPEIFQRREEGVVAAVEHRDVHPVDAPAGGFDAGIGKLDRLSEIVGPKARPAAQRAKAEMIAERHLLRDVRREIAHLRQAALDRAVERKAWDGAIRVLDLGRAVPLDRKLARWDFLDDLGDLGARCRLIARPD